MYLSATFRVLIICIAVIGSTASIARASLLYSTIAPCRLVDTRTPGSGGPLVGGINQTVRRFLVRFACGVPGSAKAVALNVTVVNPSDPGYAAVFPEGSASPSTMPSTLNFEAGVNTANGAIVKLDSSYVEVWAGFGPGKTFDLILDVTGYFE